MHLIGTEKWSIFGHFCHEKRHFYQHVKNCTKTEFFCLVEHIVSVNNDNVGEYYEQLCMTCLYSSNRVNPQILAAILDSEPLLK